MAKQRFGVGIVGFQPGQSWAARAHLPALQSLPDDFRIVALANSNIDSSRRAAEAIGVRPHADAAALVADPAVDVVVVTVRVPYHFEIVAAAIEAGKAVYCEWPLGNGLREAETLAAQARERGVLGVAGTQARLAPEIQHLKRLVAEGYVGKVLSTTLIGRGGNWGGTIPNAAGFAYLMDQRNGATMLTIPLGHTLAAVTDVLGGFGELGSSLSTRYGEVVVADTGERLPVSAPDQVLVDGTLTSGAPISIHYRGGRAREGATGFLWEINGTEGDLQVSASLGHTQMVPLTLSGGRGEAAMAPIEIPQALREDFPDDPVPGNVARVYAKLAEDLRSSGGPSAPSFEDAVGVHRIVDAIERAAASGTRSRF